MNNLPYRCLFRVAEDEAAVLVLEDTGHERRLKQKIGRSDCRELRVKPAHLNVIDGATSLKRF